MPIEINDLESRRFGITAARVTDPTATLDAIDVAAASAGIDLLTVRVNVDDLPRVHALEASGFQLMDTLVYYARSLEALPDAVASSADSGIRKAVSEDAAAIGALSRAAFADYIGHYHADPKLDRADADAAYIEWAEKSIKNVYVDAPVLLAEPQEKLAGFLSLRRNAPEEFEIVLNAVHPEAQGTGIYRTLVAEALKLSHGEGAARVIVSSQINNYTVQRVWSRLGFTHYRSLYTFHKWFS